MPERLLARGADLTARARSWPSADTATGTPTARPILWQPSAPTCGPHSGWRAVA